MNAKTLAIAPASFTALLETLKARTLSQSGFIRVDGPDGRRMYVAKGKIVATVHLSGWESAAGDSTPLTKSPSSKVTHEMRWVSDPIEQLRLFARLYAEMMSLAPVTKKGTEKKASSPAAQPLFVDPALVLAPAPVAQAEQDPELESVEAA